MKNMLVTLALVALSIAASDAWTQDKVNDVTDMQALRQAVKNDKRAFVESVISVGVEVSSIDTVE